MFFFMEQTHISAEGFPIRLESKLKNAALVRARERLGLGVREAAEQIGISYQFLLNYERMKKYPSPETQKKICDFYRKRESFLYEEDVFPESWRQFKPHGIYVHEERIPEEKLLALSSVSSQRLIAETSAIDELTESEMLDRKVRLLYEALAKLSPRQQHILKARFGFEGKQKTLEELGDELGVTRQRVRGIQNVALGKLRETLFKLDAQESYRYLHEHGVFTANEYDERRFQELKKVFAAVKHLRSFH